MPTRRSHQKSRSGCTTCKQRHVKCDEKGPPCGSCKIRGTTCEYASPASNPSVSPNVQDTTDPELGSMWHINDPKFPSTKRLLDLQLMSRWCSTTYKSCVTEVAEDDVVWQKKIPEWSIHYDFLLDGILALAAYEIASSSEEGQAEYVSVAEEYQGRALTSFRRQLSQVNSESLEPTLCFSMLLLVLALASAQFIPTLPHAENDIMLQKTLAHFQLVRGCSTVIQDKDEWIRKNPYINKLRMFEDLPRLPLDPQVETALSKLSATNESRIEASMLKSYEDRLQEVTRWKACKNAIEQLRECYARCEDKHYQGYILGWLNLAGDDYMDAIKADDETALLVLMFWGVLAEKLSYLAWWAKSFGRLLVEEISDRYQAEEASSLTLELTSLARELCQTSVSNSGTEDS